MSKEQEKTGPYEVPGEGVPVPGSVPSSLRELGTRIKEAANTLGPRENAARVMNVSTDQLARYMRGENEPSVLKVASLAAASGFRLEYLVSGDLPARVAPLGVAEERPPYKSDRPGYVYLPLYDVRGKAGVGGELVGTERVVDMLAFTEDFIRRELRQDPADLMLASVDGDSGEPDLRAGDICLINRADTGARREGIYYVRLDGAILVKQIQRLPGGVLRLSSRNPKYESFDVSTALLADTSGDFAIIGRVVWACRRF